MVKLHESFKSKGQCIYWKFKKTALSGNDDKRIQLDDCKETYGTS